MIGGEIYKKTKGYLGEDIHEGKFSLIVIHSLKQQKGRLFEILKSRTEDEQLINEVRINSKVVGYHNN